MDRMRLGPNAPMFEPEDLVGALHDQVTPAPAALVWECPRCQKVHAPSVPSCPRSDSLRARIRRGMAGRS